MLCTMLKTKRNTYAKHTYNIFIYEQKPEKKNEEKVCIESINIL